MLGIVEFARVGSGNAKECLVENEILLDAKNVAMKTTQVFK